MAPERGLINADKENPKGKNLSIEIEPPYPLIMATAQFFRAQKKPEQSLELCRLGLNHFPGDLGLRLGSVLAYLDLEEKDQAWTEIKAVSKELNQLAPILEYFSKQFQSVEQNKLADWFEQLSQILSKYPEEGLEIKAAPQVPSLPSEEKLEELIDNNVLEPSLEKDPESQVDSPVSLEATSPPSQGKNKDEIEITKDAHHDSNVLSTLSGWLSQLKDGKA